MHFRVLGEFNQCFFMALVMWIAVCSQEISEELDLKIKKYLRGGAANLEVCLNGSLFFFRSGLFLEFVNACPLFSGITR